jgi:2-acylglycerol O-acyltransferase 2
MYQAPPCTWTDVLLARITLGLLFFLTLAYVVVTPALVYYGWQWWPSPWIPLLLGLLLSTPWWARGPWRAFGETRGFEAWRRYFWFKVWREEPDFGQNKNVMLALVPHGLFPLALPLLSGVQDEVFPDLKPPLKPPEGVSAIQTAVASAMFWTPVLAPMLRWFGCIPASKTPVIHALEQGTCLLIPDGIAGAFHSDSGEECVYLETRMGFIRVALQQGSLLVPIYCFGHTQLWDVWPKHDSWIAQASRRFQFSLIWFWGEWWLPALPRRVPLTMVVGKGIHLAKEEHPSPERIRQVHTQFTQALSSLYCRYRNEAGYPVSKPLLIV